MADKQHSEITDPHLHEPKGVATATAGQVYISDGNGSGTWTDANVKGSLVLRGVSLVDQEPSGLDEAGKIQASFGAGSSTSEASLSGAGTLTITQAGTYLLTFTGSFGRTTSAGVAYLAARVLLNDTPILDPIVHKLDDFNSTVPFTFTLLKDFSVNDTIKIEVLRDSLGIDNGGLYSETLASGWGATPSAGLTLYKMEIAS